MQPGTRLGPFEVIAVLGAGGMGEVYRARDTTLDRDVALKVLPASVAHTPERLARLEREARLLAALNHQHVGAIYGIQDDGSTRALVLELVEGETLADVIEGCRRRGQSMPLDEIVRVARQVASALDAAHQKGIIHRDLKPANVKLRPDGVVKVLDFGLGRAASPLESDALRDPSMTSDATLPGSILGTPAYMSPEQARGQALDKRTDIWAFGCLVFEMLTGSRAFGGQTVSDSIARVIGSEPDWTLLPAHAPYALRRLVRRCLEKDPARRLRDIGDAELDEEPPREVARPPRIGEDVRLERLTDSVGPGGAPALSPDGKMVAFVAVTGGRRQIWIRLLAGGTPLQVTRDDADHNEPRWLPDSSAIVYHSPAPKTESGHLCLVSALGGPPRRIAPALAGGDVSHDGRRIACFQQTPAGVALVAVALDRSTTETVLDLAPEHQYLAPRWSPDDRAISFVRSGLLLEASLDVVTPGERQRRTLAQAAWIRGHAWLPDGAGIVYSGSTGSTMVYPPTNNLRLVGADGRDDRQLTFGDVAYHAPDVGREGRIVAARVRVRSDVWRFPTGGTPVENVQHAVQVTHQSGQVQTPAVSPDGTEIAYVSDMGGHSNLWIAAVDGTAERQLTFESDPAVAVGVPVWSPDGSRIACVVARSGTITLSVTATDGSGVIRVVPDAFSPAWSGDGRTLYHSAGLGRISKIDLESGHVSVVRTDHASAAAVFPDGRGLCFTRLPEMPRGLLGDTTICRAVPEDGPAEEIARVAFARVVLAPRLHLQAWLSPDGRWLAFPLADATTTNIWTVAADGGPMRAVTDFGDRSVSIARSVSWSPDSRSLYAAVADTVTDVVSLIGLLNP